MARYKDEQCRICRCSCQDSTGRAQNCRPPVGGLPPQK